MEQKRTEAEKAFDREMRAVRADRNRRSARKEEESKVWNWVFYLSCALAFAVAWAYGPRYVEKLTKESTTVSGDANQAPAEQLIKENQQLQTEAIEREAAYEAGLRAGKSTQKTIEPAPGIVRVERADGGYDEHVLPRPGNPNYPRAGVSYEQEQAESASRIYESMQAEQNQRRQIRTIGEERAEEVSRYWEHYCDVWTIGSIRERQCRNNVKKSLTENCKRTDDHATCYVADAFRPVH